MDPESQQQQPQSSIPEPQVMPQIPLVANVELPKSMLRDILREEEVANFQVAKPVVMAASVNKKTRFAPVFSPAGADEASSAVQMTPINAGDTPYQIAKKARIWKNQPLEIPPDFHEQAERRLRANEAGSLFGPVGDREFRADSPGSDPNKGGILGNVLDGPVGESWMPDAETKPEYRGLGQTVASLANGMTLGYTGRFTNDWVSEFRQRYDTGNGFLNFMQFDAAAIAGSLMLFNSPVGVFTPTGAAWSAGGGLVKAAGSALMGGNVPSWVMAGARLRSLRPLYTQRWLRLGVEGHGPAARGTAQFVGSKTVRSGISKFGEGVQRQWAGAPMESTMNPIEWAGKFFGWKASKAMSPKLYSRLEQVLKIAGGKIGDNGRIYIPKGKYYGYVKRLLGVFKARAGVAGVKLEITSNPDLVGPAATMSEMMFVTTTNSAGRMIRGAQGAASMVGGSPAVGAAWGAANPQDYQTGEEYWGGDKISRATAMKRGVKEGLEFTGKFLGAAMLGRAALGPAAGLLSRVKGIVSDPKVGAPQRLLGEAKGPAVTDGAVVLRPEPNTSQTTPRQSLHNATPEPPTIKMPLTGTSEYQFQSVTGKNPTWIEKAEFEKLMLAHPELSPLRAELDRKRMIVEQLRAVATNMDEGASQPGADGAPDAVNNP